MSKPLSEWTLDDARDAINKRLPEDYERRAGYVLLHDHWQKGKEWIGPRGSPDVEAIILDAVSRQFVPVDTIGEALDHAEEGLFTVEPKVEFVPRVAPVGEAAEEAAKARADELREIISGWWDTVQVWERASEAFRDSLWATRGVLRVRIPRGKLQGDTGATALPSVSDLAEALALLRLAYHEPSTAAVFEDPDTLQRGAVFTYMEGDEERAEVWIQNGEAVEVRILGADVAPYPLPLARLPFAQVEGRPLITGEVMRQQQRRNFAESLLSRVAETAGFAERHITNAEPPGIWLDTPPSVGPAITTETDERGKTWYKHSAPLTVGAAVVNFMRGLPTGANGENLTSPQVTFKEPTDPEFAIKACSYARRTILQSCKQGHFTAEGGEASGVAYQQARAGFEAWLRRRKGGVEGLIRDTLEAALTLAAAMGAEDVLADYRINVDLTVNPGPVLAEQQRVIMELRGAGLRSIESALSETGVEDVAAEIARLEEDGDLVTANLERLAPVLEQMDRAALLTLELAAEMLVSAGVPIEDAEAYARQLAEARAPAIGAPGSGFGNEGAGEIIIPGLEA